MLVKFEIFEKDTKLGTVLFEKSLRRLIKEFPELTFRKWYFDDEWVEDKKYKLSLF